MLDELDTNQNSEQNPVTSTPNADKIQEISEFYQDKKTTTDATAEPIIERSPIDYYVEAFRKYATFSGRATRSEYWYFILFNTIISVVLVLTFGEEVSTENIGLVDIYAIITVLPILSVTVRRLHDVGKSGWFLLISIIPIIGGLWLLILYVRDSTPGANKYGPNPKGIEV
jgi:uncharacterized membrane protein YhaH (DUF805 family)